MRVQVEDGRESQEDTDDITTPAERTPSPSPWAAPSSPPPAPRSSTRTPTPSFRPPAGVELPSDRNPVYEPPGPYEQVASWSGPSAYQSSIEEVDADEPRPAGPPGPSAGWAGRQPATAPAGSPPAGGPPGSPPSSPPGGAANRWTDAPRQAVSGNGGSPGATAGPAWPGQFNPGDLLRPRQPAPAAGIRRVLYRVSGGRFNLGPSANDQARQRLLDRARTPAVTGRRRIAMISLKGGVGKTTTTVMLGHTLATVRGDNVIAVDANPDAGNLASRVRRETERSARDLLNASHTLDRYADVRSYTSQAASRLEVLAGESDPALSEAFSAADYEAVLIALERFYSIVLTDCGTGILHDAMRAVLWYVDQLIVVTSPAIDSAHALGQLLDWLDQHGYHHLVQGAIVTVNGVRKKSEIRVEQFAATFGTRCRGVVTIPYDATLSTGGESSLQALTPATQQAYLELAAAVGDGFSQPGLHGHDPRPSS